MAFEDTHSGHLFYQSEMPIVPYRSLSQDVPIYEKSTLHRCKVLFGAENGARTRDLNLLARPPQTAFISVDDGSYATDPREKEANEFA